MYLNQGERCFCWFFRWIKRRKSSSRKQCGTISRTRLNTNVHLCMCTCVRLVTAMSRLHVSLLWQYCRSTLTSRVHGTTFVQVVGDAESIISLMRNVKKNHGTVFRFLTCTTKSLPRKSAMVRGRRVRPQTNLRKRDLSVFEKDSITSQNHWMRGAVGSTPL